MALATVVVPEGAAASDLTALLHEPAAALRRGALVAFPTETVYGLGADAMSAHAVERVFIAKGRPTSNPLIVHLPDADRLSQVVADITPLAAELAATHWPGPLTLVLRAHPAVPQVVTGGLATVAVRVPAHGLARRLIELSDTPVAAPSANLSGRPSPTTAAHVRADLGARIDWIVDGGPCTVGIESTVVDARGDRPVVLREGSVTREALGLGPDDPAEEDGGAPASPGTVHPHYQPRARVVIAEIGGAVAEVARLVDRFSVAVLGPDDTGLDPRVHRLGAPIGAEELAVVLYGALRTADDLGADVVVVEAVPADGMGRAVMDRLRRAAGEA